MHKNLWGELLPVDNIRTPYLILKEQANELTALTKGLLNARVRTANDKSGDIRHTLEIIAPALNNYVFRVLSVHHGIALYPALIECHAVNKVHESKDEPDFLEKLATSLTADAVRNAIRGMIAQSSAASQ